MADDPKLSTTYRRMQRGGIRQAKKTKARLASGDPKWTRHLKLARQLGTTTGDMDRLIKTLEREARGLRKKAHKSDARSRVGGGAPGSFVAVGLARSPKGR